MFNDLLYKIKTVIVTLRFSILSVFIILFVITLSMLVSIFYFHMFKIVERAGMLLLNEVSYSVQDELYAQLKPEELEAQLTVRNVRHGVIDVNNQTELTAYMVHMLKELPLAQGAFWGGMQGNFAYVRKAPRGQFSAEFINREAKPPIDQHLLLDSKHNILKQTVSSLDFDPRTRPWFTEAISKKQTIWTDIYLIERGSATLGVTVATPAVDDNGYLQGVFGIDVGLDYLSRYLSQLKVGEHGEIFIVDQHGKIIASQNEKLLPSSKGGAVLSIDIINKPYIVEAFKQYKARHKPLFRFKYGGIRYLASFNRIKHLPNNHWVIAIVDVASDFNNQVHQVAFYYLFISFTIFIAGIFLMASLVNRIVNPIKKLVKETERIKYFHLEETPRIQSRIKEVIKLSDAIYSMRSGLRSFGRYVPATLVRQLISSGEGVRIGGTKRQLVVFFSDISDFTRIAESSESEQLVKQVCDYLDNFS